MGSWWTIDESEEALRACLDDAIPLLIGRRATVETIRCEHFRYASSCACYVVTIQLAGGEVYRTFLKDFGSSKRLQDHQQPRAAREVGVYRDLLSSACLDTPRYLGSVWDQPSARFWLLLECVDGRQLRHCEFLQWRATAAWLARMHGYFARRLDQLDGCGYLSRFDGSDVQNLGKSALHAVTEMSADLGERLAPVVGGVETMIDLMDSLPPTLVHGAFRPQQVVIGPSNGPSRVCVVDWESAAIGSGLNDLAELTLDVEPPQVVALVDAYRDEATRCGICLPDRDVTLRMVNCFRLRLILRRLNRPHKPKGKWNAQTLVEQAEGLGLQCL